MIRSYRLLYVAALATVFIISDLSFLSPKTRHVTLDDEEPPRSYRPKKQPPLDTLLPKEDSEAGIVGDVSNLLNIAILGHAKCATTFVLKWLNRHPDVDMFPQENCLLYDRKPAKLARTLHVELSKDKLRGFKCPGHFSSSPMRYFQKYFPKAKLIVGLRHPVAYFQSYYNFRNRHLRLNTTLPPAETLIGPCTLESQGVCTQYAKFHVNLAKLGKTNWSSTEEQKLLNNLPSTKSASVVVPNQLFLYDLKQLYDKNLTRLDQFANDMTDFLELPTPLQQLGRDPVASSQAKKETLNICDSRYNDIRVELVAIGKRASIWLRKFLLQSESVVVSNREHFDSILRSWKYDPCSLQQYQ